MKIGSIICEYNPFHNGHAFAINEIKSKLKPDAVVCIMSGCFTQRGTPAVTDKYTRARHAILAGADLVLELPTAFATAPAEIFAKGAVKLLSTLSAQNSLCFGMENADKSTLLKVAGILSREPNEFKAELKKQLAEGATLAKAKHAALEFVLSGEKGAELLRSPNNLLAVEYARAVLEGEFNIDLFPIQRDGSAYLSETLKKGEYPSAAAIRKCISCGRPKKAAKFVPSLVLKDLPNSLPCCDDMIMAALHIKSKKELAEILDCTEGLENRIKALLKDNYSLNELLSKLATRRYTSTRLARVTLSALLGITKNDVFKYLKSDLYLKVLAVNSQKIELLSALGGKTPFITRKSDVSKLRGAAAACFETDSFACDIYSCLIGKRVNEYATLFVNPQS